MSEGPGPRRKRSRATVILVAFILAVLLVEAVLVVAVFVSPSTSEKLQSVAASLDRTWNGTDESPGLRTRTARAFHTGYQNWVRPIWAKPRMPAADREFTACVECHKDYATKRRFSSVYMNHPLHAELGVACATCHTQNLHPDPVRPLEKVCADCHTEVNEDDGCGTCHPPGSLPHFYLMGAPRAGVVECDVCHPKGSFDTNPTTPLVHTGDFSGSNKGQCLSCHQSESCRRCHAEPHPANWISEHGRGTGYGGATSCFSCHTSLWCADRCHAVTPTNPFVPKTLPPVGVHP